jgi:repressor LexA
LHEKRREILEFLARRSREDGAPPSIREICAAVRLRSTQTVHHHLRRLEETGHIVRLDDRYRTPRLTERGWEAAGELPLLGRIAAGRGVEAVAVGDEVRSLAAELLGSRSGGQRYLLRVVGDSMTGAHILDGDLCVVEVDEDPPDGAVVVALLSNGEEVTVKRLFREGAAVRLKPENERYTDIVVPVEDVRVQGRVLYVIHPPRR